MEMQSAVCVIVVNWNSGALLAKCAESVGAYGADTVSELVIVDNASSDESLERALRVTSPNTTVIRNVTNVGFAVACNQGARLASAPFILFLNPDARLLPDSLSEVIQRLSDPGWSDVGIVGLQLVDESGHTARNCARFPRPHHYPMRAVGLDRVFVRQRHFIEDWDHCSSREVDQVIGACFLVRTEVFRALRGFDEQFFVYFEELDFSLRARQAGWRSMYFAEARAFHLGGGTSSQVKALRLFYSLRSRLLYSRKHFGRMGHFVVTISTLLLEPISRVGQCLLSGSALAARSTVSGYGALYGWLCGNFWVLWRGSGVHHVESDTSTQECRD